MLRNLRLLLLFQLCCLPFFASVAASPQKPDYIVYNHDTIATYNLLVEQYINKFQSTKTSKLFNLNFRDGASFNCWRGYQAIYLVEHDSLFVTDIIGCGELQSGKINKASSATKMKETFGNQLVNGKMYIDWFSGDLNFRLTDKILRWDGVFSTTYERERVLSFLYGKLTNVTDVDNYVDDPKAIDRRYKTKLSDIIFTKLKKVNWRYDDDCDCSASYTIIINTDGKIDEVESNSKPDTTLAKDGFDERKYCMDNIRMALKNMCFDVIKSAGKPVTERVFIELWFENNGKIKNWSR